MHAKIETSPETPPCAVPLYRLQVQFILENSEHEIACYLNHSLQIVVPWSKGVLRIDPQAYNRP
jgi:hypothetical protein